MKEQENFYKTLNSFISIVGIAVLVGVLYLLYGFIRYGNSTERFFGIVVLILMAFFIFGGFERKWKR